jgi:hypothetical protein
MREMTFDKIHTDIQFKCITNDMSQNVTDIFVRRVGNAALSDKDFLSYREEGRKLEDDTQKVICMSRGLSILKIENNNEESILNTLRPTMKPPINFKPRKKYKIKFFCKMRFKNNAGLVWKTPSKDNPYHHTFFKCDDFNMGDIEVLEVAPITYHD